jgi:hypothetical protein
MYQKEVIKASFTRGLKTRKEMLEKPNLTGGLKMSKELLEITLLTVVPYPTVNHF